MKKFLSKKNSMSKLVIVIIALTSLLSISISCFILDKVIKSHDEEMIKVIALDVFDDINNELLKLVAVSQTMASDKFLIDYLKSGSEDEIPTYLQQIRKHFEFGQAYLAVEKSRNYYTVNGFTKHINWEIDPHDRWYRDIMYLEKSYMLNVDTDEVKDMSLGIFVNTKIKDRDGNFLGVCGVGVEMQTIQNIIEINEKSYGIKINLVDRRGIVQVDTNSIDIEKTTLENLVANKTSEQFTIREINGSFIITKYIPAFDWYLVIQRNNENMKSAFSNLILYLLIGFSIALVILLKFIRMSLNYEQQKIEKSAKRHGIASHAGLYVSMHLVDLKSDSIYELSRDPNIQLFNVQDGDHADLKIIAAVKDMTNVEDLESMLEFTNLKTISDRMCARHVITHEFLSERFGYCKAYFMKVEQDQIVFALEIIDEAKRREKHLLYLSKTDSMTGLRNRGSGERKIKSLIAEGIEGMFCLLDADKFKSINDNFGHDIGDKVIIEIADCLQKTFRNSDVIMRLGGDEFAVYAQGITDEERGNIVIDRFFNLIDRIEISELGDRKISISLGASFFKASDDLTFEELYKRADSATYESKKVNGNFATFYHK